MRPLTQKDRDPSTYFDLVIENEDGFKNSSLKKCLLETTQKVTEN